MKWFRPGNKDDFDDEIDTHVEMLAARYRTRGMTDEEARIAARRQFGNKTSLKESRKDMRPGVWFETMFNDIRYAVRVLLKNKAFAAVAILTLALGIGANTAIFSIVDAAILRPLPYPDPARLVILWGNVKRVHVERRGASYPDFLDWRSRSRSYEAMAAFEDAELALTGIETPVRIPGEFVSDSYFSLLGVRAARGRTFRPEEDLVPQRDAVAVLSDRCWKNRFGADPGIIGRKVPMEGRVFTVIGVAPPDFQGLTDRAEIWVPFVMSGDKDDFAERANRGFEVLARLKPGVSSAQAQAEIDAISHDLERAYPKTNEARGVELSPLTTEILGDVRKPLLVLLAAVGFVLLIAGTNVVNLVLARSEGRQRELAMRMALGASRGRLLRQLMTESFVLVACGCAAALALAHYGVRALMAYTPLSFPSFVHPTLDLRVGIFTVVICCATAVILASAPVIGARRTSFEAALKQSAGRSSGGRRGQRFRDIMVIGEVAFSLLLLIGAGLMIRSLMRIAQLDPGYDPSHVVHLRVSLLDAQGAAQDVANAPADRKMTATANDILRNVSAVPGVQSASIATDAPLVGGNAVFYTAEGQPPMNAQTAPRAYYHRVSSDFFRTLRTPFLAGRSFTEDEVRGFANVAIVTENMVKRFWPGQNPLGKRIRLGVLDSKRPWMEIVGVIGVLKYRGVPRNPDTDPDLFMVFNQRSTDFSVLVRTSLDPALMLNAVRKRLAETAPSVVTYQANTLDTLVGRQTASPRFMSWLMTIFAAIALGLALIGIYGVMSYTIARRTRDIGVRIALGAGRGEVVRSVLVQGMAMAAIGIALGITGALALTRMLGSLVYDVSAADPQTFVAAAGLLAAVAAVACLRPALRASRIDPVCALRSE